MSESVLKLLNVLIERKRNGDWRYNEKRNGVKGRNVKGRRRKKRNVLSKRSANELQHVEAREVCEEVLQREE